MEKRETFGQMILALGGNICRDLDQARILLAKVKGHNGEEAATQCVLRLKEALLWLEEVSGEDV